MIADEAQVSSAGGQSAVVTSVSSLAGVLAVTLIVLAAYTLWHKARSTASGNSGHGNPQAATAATARDQHRQSEASFVTPTASQAKVSNTSMQDSSIAHTAS